MGSRIIKVRLQHSLQTLEKHKTRFLNGTTPTITQTQYIPNTSLEFYVCNITNSHKHFFHCHNTQNKHVSEAVWSPKYA